jgi:hypothetical protein
MREIRYLVKAFKKTNNAAYLHAAEKGVRYYLKAQNTMVAGRNIILILLYIGARSPTTMMR